MRVKWNRNLDGIRPLITVPETDIISNGKREDLDNNCDNSSDNKTAFTDLNENQTDSELIHKNGNGISDHNIDLRGQTCESPSPSSVSITSKRSDRSKARISSLFGLFKVKDKTINDNCSEDGVSNYSELSNATIPSLISPSIAKRKSSYGSRDSILLTNEKIGFEADTRRRRRANSLLARSSLRRSWQQLNATNKSSIGSTYMIAKERLPNHCLITSHSPQTVRHKSSEQDWQTLSRSSQIRLKSDYSPEVRVRSNFGNISEVSTQEVYIETETNRTGSESESNRILCSVETNECKRIENNSVVSMQTDVQTLKSRAHCITESDLNIKNCGSNGCDGVDSKVQSVVNSLDSENILFNNSKMIFDPKNSFKYIRNEPKLDYVKTDANILNTVTKNGVQKQNSNCVNQNIDITDSDSNTVEQLATVTKTDVTTQTTPQLKANRKSDNLIDVKLNAKDIENYVNINSNYELSEKFGSSQTDEQTVDSCDSQISPKVSLTPINGCTDNIIKVKVKKNQLPESEVVCFSAQIVSSPQSLANANTDNEYNNDRAVVLTFINDEPMTSTDKTVDKENNKSDICVKSAPIQGILRVRSKDSNSEDTSSNGLSKTNEVITKSQKKVHFADNCLHNRNASHSRNRSVKGRHYSSLGVVASINDRKTSNRRPIHSNTTTGSSLPSKRLNGKIIGTNANPSKKDSRSSQSAEDKQQIQKLTQLCETKTKQLKNLDINQNYMRLAFDSLAVVIQHLIEQFEPFENPKLKNDLQIANERCEQLKDDLNAKDVELNDMRLIFEEQINQLMKEREKNYSDLNQAKVSHESSVKKLKEIHSIEVKRICEKYENQLFLSQQNCNQLKNEIQEKTIELVETKQLRDALEVKTKQMEDNIMNDKDKKFKYLSEKSKQLELEVDSLKAVMDMKNEKIHSLERKMIETQEKISELPTAKESVRSLQQQVETLQITLDRKIHQFNQLTRQHEDLKLEFDREMREKRRLSMKNEELAFHLSESFHESATPGLNNCTNFFDSHPFKTPVPVRVLHNDETPIKVNRSISINNGPTPTERAFTRKSHSKVNRSVSASSGTSNSTSKNSTFIYCPLSSGPEVENNFIANNDLSDSEVFDSGTGFSELSHRRHEPNRKSFKVKRIERLSDETTPQSIFDSGFEEIQGLSSLPK